MKINSYLFVFKSSMLDIEFDAEITWFRHIIDQLRLLPKINPSIFKIRNLSWFIQDIPNKSKIFQMRVYYAIYSEILNHLKTSFNSQTVLEYIVSNNFYTICWTVTDRRIKFTNLLQTAPEDYSHLLLLYHHPDHHFLKI